VFFHIEHVGDVARILNYFVLLGFSGNKMIYFVCELLALLLNVYTIRE